MESEKKGKCSARVGRITQQEGRLSSRGMLEKYSKKRRTERGRRKADGFEGKR